MQWICNNEMFNLITAHNNFLDFDYATQSVLKVFT